MLLSHLALAFLVACGDDEETTPPPVECDTGSSIVDSGVACNTDTHTSSGTGTSTQTVTDTGTGTATQTGTGSSTSTATSTQTATDTDTATGTGGQDTAELVDADGDGVAAAEDCDDANPFVYPGNFETCDGVDEDCDGVIDNDAWDARVFLLDLDHDGYGVDGTDMYACEAPLDAVEQGGDCDDENWLVNPGSLVPECGDIAFLDLNCDGSVGSEDFDGDGFTACDDCNDADSGVFPGAAEVCNGGADDDCNGLADDEDPALVADAAAAGKSEFYADFDMDGFTPGAGATLSCDAAPGFVAANQLYSLERTMRDCDDNDGAVSPEASEVCDGEDNDCDQLVDDADDNVDPGSRRFVRDADADGYAVDGSEIGACVAPAGFVVSAANGGGDCDDDSAAVHPGASEVCNLGVDDDCDGTADDFDTSVTGAPTWYADLDGDGFVGEDEDEAPVAAAACIAPIGYYAMADLEAELDAVSGMPVLVQDCSDDPFLDWYAYDVNPAATEACNGRDDNCDDLADDADVTVDPAGFTTWYLDADMDGYTPSSTPVETCDAPAGYTYYVWNTPDPSDPDGFVADCDDTLVDVDDPADDGVDGSVVYPGAYDAWYDGLDADCDLADDYDQDGDGFAGMLADGNPGTDCNDVDANAYPGAPVDTAYDGVDQDCSNGDLVDVDGDGEPSEAVGGEDCDDEDAAIKPGMTDIPYDGIDQDCSGADLSDVDGDGVTGGPSGSDCDDTDPNVRPGVNELCATAADDDCDGQTNEPSAVDASRWYVDADGDHYTTGSFQVACAAPDATYAAEASLLSSELDCDDAAAGTNPGKLASDDVAYDGIDQDCSGEDVTDVDKDGVDAVAAGGTDCDDNDDAVRPGASELCATAADDDCDGQTNEPSAVDAKRWYVDADGDHYTTGTYQLACAAPDATYVDEVTLVPRGSVDCNDSEAAANPGVAAETCATAFDDNCDGRVNDITSVDVATFYEDADGDHYSSGDRIDACVAPSGYVAAGTLTSLTAADCDDSVLTGASVHPGMDEDCDTLADDDCDGRANDMTSADAQAWRKDADGDGFATFDSEIACDAPAGYVAAASVDATRADCDDALAAVSPAASEQCATLLDDDCDGQSNEADAVDATTWFVDADSDSYGFVSPTAFPLFACEQPDGYVGNVDDCDDGAGAINPGADELCSTVEDDNCDGLVNDPSAVDAPTWYTDLDGDGHAAGVSEVSCTDPGPTAYLPVELVSTSDDCDDLSATRSPDNTEVCDAIDLDEDCDGLADDADPNTSAATKSTWYVDADGDGYGTGAFVDACESPGVTYAASLVSSDIDCDDARALSNPGGVEVCLNLYDDDCSGYDPATGMEDPPAAYGADACDTLSGSKVLANADVVVAGEVASDFFGIAVVGANVFGNADGDVVVAAYGQDAGGSNGGAIYVYGSNSFGTHARKFTGAANEQLGFNGSIAAVPDAGGGVYDDLVVGATGSNRAYLVDGSSVNTGPSGALSTLSRAVLSLGSATGADVVATYVGDVNGDQVGDFVVGSPGNSGGFGQVGLFLGRSGRELGGTTWFPDVMFQGKQVGGYAGTAQRFGAAVAGAVDLDGDDLDDVVMGLPYNTASAARSYPGTATDLLHGAIAIYYGRTTSTASTPSSSPTAVAVTELSYIRGERIYDRFGYAVTGLGDQNGDGYDDIAVGADLYGNSSTTQGDATTCTAVSCQKGAVYVINGGATRFAAAAQGNTASPSLTSVGSVFAARYVASSGSDREFLGRSIRGGDINRDGYGDLIMGAPQAGPQDSVAPNAPNAPGAAYVAYGPVAQGSFDIDAAYNLKVTGNYSAFGSVVGVVGDVDGDAYDDVLIGHFKEASDRGGLYAFSGAGQ
ncbi:MAG: hypothetical protein RLZZ299_1353 [Pseudomonadota bacterium]|jgi:hypothetical protein